MQVAKINGKEVHSDKQVSAIRNTRVEFSDGSWCDVETGHIHNNGPGYINIGTPETQEDDPKKVVRKEFPSARQLRIAGLDSVKIEVGNQFEVAIEGPESEVKNISVTLQGDTVVMRTTESGSSSSGISITSSGGGRRTVISGGRGGRTIIANGDIISVGGGATVVTGGSIHIGGNSISVGQNEATTQATITVPKGTPVELESVRDAVVGNTEGNLTISLDGSKRVKAGSVKNLSLSLEGSVRVNVQKLTGFASINTAGSARVEVDSGKVDQVMIAVSGSSRINFNATAQMANVTASGSARINLGQVINRPLINKSGSARISVANW